MKLNLCNYLNTKFIHKFIQYWHQHVISYMYVCTCE